MKEFTIFGGDLYFVANEGGTGTEYQLYKTDGATIDKLPETNDTDNVISELTVFNSELYFVAKKVDPLHAGEYITKLYKTDGTTVTQVSDIQNDDVSMPYNNNDDPSDLIVFNNELYFLAQNDTDLTALFKYDGTTIYQLSDYHAGAHDILGEFDGELYVTMPVPNDAVNYSSPNNIKLFKVTTTNPASP